MINPSVATVTINASTITVAVLWEPVHQRFLWARADELIVLVDGAIDVVDATQKSTPIEIDGYGGDATLLAGSADDLLVAGPGANSLVAGPATTRWFQRRR